MLGPEPVVVARCLSGLKRVLLSQAYSPRADSLSSLVLESDVKCVV